MAQQLSLIVGGTAGLGYELYQKSANQNPTLLVGRRDVALRSNNDQILHADLSSQDSTEKLLRTLRERAQIAPITDFIWVAGVLKRAPSLELKPTDLLTMIDVNLRHPLLVATWVWQQMHTTDQPCHFTVVASTTGVSTAPRDDEAVYAAAKSAQVSFARAIEKRNQVASKKVSLFCPGGMKTQFWKENPIEPEMLSSFLDPARVAVKILLERSAQHDAYLELVIPRGSL